MKGHWNCTQSFGSICKTDLLRTKGIRDCIYLTLLVCPTLYANKKRNKQKASHLKQRIWYSKMIKKYVVSSKKKQRDSANKKLCTISISLARYNSKIYILIKNFENLVICILLRRKIKNIKNKNTKFWANKK